MLWLAETDYFKSQTEQVINHRNLERKRSRYYDSELKTADTTSLQLMRSKTSHETIPTCLFSENNHFVCNNVTLMFTYLVDHMRNIQRYPVYVK